MFDWICAGNGIRHLLTAPYSPTTTGKVERLHMTMRAEFFTPEDGLFATIGELQAAPDGWVIEYNTTGPHQSCGGRGVMHKCTVWPLVVPGCGPAGREKGRAALQPAVGDWRLRGWRDGRQVG